MEGTPLIEVLHTTTLTMFSKSEIEKIKNTDSYKQFEAKMLELIRKSKVRNQYSWFFGEEVTSKECSKH